MPALALIFNAFVWGLSWFPFRHIEGHGLHPVWTTCLIYLAIATVVGLLRRGAWAGFAAHPMLVLLGLAAGFTNVGFNWAVTQGDVVRVVLLFYLMPLWSVLLGWAVLGERPTGGSLARVALALAGVAVVLKTPGTDWPVPSSLPDWLGVAAGFGFAVTNIVLRQLRAAPGESRALAMFCGCAVVAGTTALAGTALGMTSKQSLRLVLLPLALPTLLAGVRTATAIAIGTATIAAFIGAGGFGERIVTGLALNDRELLVAGALPAAALALLSEGVFELVEFWLRRRRRAPPASTVP